MNTTTWWFGIEDPESDFCGEEFFVEVHVPMDRAERCAVMIAENNFPGEEIQCYGRIGNAEAEMMGLDTYQVSFFGGAFAVMLWANAPSFPLYHTSQVLSSKNRKLFLKLFYPKTLTTPNRKRYNKYVKRGKQNEKD